MFLKDEEKQSKIFELTNLIFQYDSGERKNLNVTEYQQWIMIFNMLKIADIEENIYNDFLKNPTHYKIIDNEIVYNPDWEQEAKINEEKRINNLHITKLDFFNNIIKPANISYETLINKIKELNMQAEWDLCNHVYYGVVKSFLSELPLQKTEAEIISVFEELSM